MAFYSILSPKYSLVCFIFWYQHFSVIIFWFTDFLTRLMISQNLTEYIYIKDQKSFPSKKKVWGSWAWGKDIDCEIETKRPRQSGYILRKLPRQHTLSSNLDKQSVKNKQKKSIFLFCLDNLFPAVCILGYYLYF